MPVDFKFPDVGEGITEGEIVKWLVKEGQAVKEHDVLAEIETDKAVVEMPSPASGNILKIYKKQGETIKLGETLVTIGKEDEALSEKPQELPKEKKSFGVVGELEEAPDEDEEPPKPAALTQQKEVLALPSVRKMAQEKGINLSEVKGSGKDWRILEEDLTPKQASPTEPAPEEVHEGGIKITRKYDMFGYIDHIPLKGVRKAVAKNMVLSHTTNVHVTHMDEIDITELYKIREKAKKQAEKKGIHLTFMPYILRACILALKKHPYVNSSASDTEIILKKYYNIGVAVDTQDGLIVPVVKIADIKKLFDMAKEIEILADKARKRKLDIMDMRGGTFTITNIGSLGGVFATPIINPPESAILALGRMIDKPVVIKGKIKIRKILPLSLTFDHRVIDGAEGARFVNSIKEFLQNPKTLEDPKEKKKKPKEKSKKIECPVCSKKFNELKDLIKHEMGHVRRKHTKKKPVKRAKIKKKPARKKK